MNNCLLTLLTAGSLIQVATAAERVDYEQHIKPLLREKCAACHGALEQEAGLRLDAGTLIRQGGDSGPAIEPGDAAASLLLQRVVAEDPSQRMPPEGEGERLNPAQIANLTAWIASGADFPAEETVPVDPAQHWAYQTVARPALPARWAAPRAYEAASGLRRPRLAGL